MKYHLDMFTPETWADFRATFSATGAAVSGFGQTRRRASERVNIGDIFICYLTRVSRWCGALEVQSRAYFSDEPLFGNHDPFPIKFRVKPIVLLDPGSSIPIREERVWQKLTITNRHDPSSNAWTGFVRSSLNTFEDDDGGFLVDLLQKQKENPEDYPLTDRDRRQLSLPRIRTPDGEEVEVEVPDNEEPLIEPDAEDAGQRPDERESVKYQAKVAQIGAEMGFRIWVPRNDKARVLNLIPQELHDKFLDQLPMNYDDVTIRTVEQIDVLWIDGRSMSRAFEVEHTTAVYSGILRMADLLALQPNMDIRLHIVAPIDRKDRVLREIKRPVFSLLNRGPLYGRCSYLSYDSIEELAKTQHLAHMNDSIIAEYEESTEV